MPLPSSMGVPISSLGTYGGLPKNAQRRMQRVSLNWERFVKCDGIGTKSEWRASLLPDTRDDCAGAGSL